MAILSKCKKAHVFLTLWLNLAFAVLCDIDGYGLEKKPVVSKVSTHTLQMMNFATAHFTLVKHFY